MVELALTVDVNIDLIHSGYYNYNLDCLQTKSVTIKDNNFT